MVTLSRHVSYIEEAYVSASERRLFWLMTILGLGLLDFIIAVCCLLANGRHAALICAIVVTFVIVALSVMAAICWCLISDRLHRRLRNWWHKMCCKWWRVSYQPLPVRPAAKHLTDKVPEGNGPITRGDVVAVRHLCKEPRKKSDKNLFEDLLTQADLRPCVPGEE